jgi:hypothetical protein
MMRQESVSDELGLNKKKSGNEFVVYGTVLTAAAAAAAATRRTKEYNETNTRLAQL